MLNSVMNEQRVLTEPVENYLKAIYSLSTEPGQPEETAGAASQQRIALAVGVSISGVSKMLRSMERLELIDYSPYQPVRLTERGEKMALEIIRHHRLLELFLVKALGYGWEDVHREAERLEHYISEQMEDRIAAMLGYPTFDPHGDPIPTRDGRMPMPVCVVTLASQTPGSRVMVRRVSDADEALLRYLAERGVMPGALLEVVEVEPFGGSIVYRLAGGAARAEAAGPADADGRDSGRVTPYAAMNVFVERAEPEGSSGGGGVPCL